ncbi:MAG TPA: hypothetical protein VHG52_15355 [Thermomicrobiales bacterium]|nr:hypothetical protein [Thermomicrobiales bacterium]
MEPPHSYVRDASASVVHHGDYLNSRDDHALCGLAVENPTTLGGTEQPGAVCPDCEAKLVEYHLVWWRDTARAAMAELDELRSKYRALADRDSSGEFGEEVETEPRADSTAEPAEEEPTSLLDQARRELLQLCRQFDGSVPYRRLKNAMQTFSDGLNPDERVLLAQEIGNDGSLLRWCTTEAQSLGWSVAGNPVQAETEEMWDAWTRDSYQTPKPNKWRLGRSRGS